VQNFAARIVSGRRKFDHITSVLKELRWLPVKTQLYYRDATLAFKCLMGCAPSYLASQFITRGDVTGPKTRNSQKLNIPLFKSAVGQKRFYYRIVTLWNGIEEHLKLCSTISSFRYNLRNQLLQDFMQY
jgi:hypothetical protein